MYTNLNLYQQKIINVKKDYEKDINLKKADIKLYIFNKIK